MPYVMIRESLQQGPVTVVSIYAPKVTASSFMKQTSDVRNRQDPVQ